MARGIKAEALRKMAQATPTGIQTRNFLLHEVLVLEDKASAEQAPGGGFIDFPVDFIAQMPTGKFLETLSYKLDARYSADLFAIVRIDITDTKERYALHIRHGAAEFLRDEPQSYDLHLAFDRPAWAELYLGKANLGELVAEQRAFFHGEEILKESFIKAFHGAI